MGTLAIKEELLGRIAKLAEAGHVPLEKQAEELLLESIERHEASVKLRQLMDDVSKMTPAGARQTDSVTLLREDRNR